MAVREYARAMGDGLMLRVLLLSLNTKYLSRNAVVKMNM